MPASLRRILARIAAIFSARSRDRDFDEEYQSHLEMLTEDNFNRGMAAGEARRAARLALGSPAVLRELHRDARSLPVARTAARDLRSAWRALIAAPAHSVPVIITLALAIGVTAALFSILDSALWRRVPFTNASRLVEIWNHVYEPQNFHVPGSTREQVLAWRRQKDLFDWVEAYEKVAVIYQTPLQAHLIDGALVTPALLTHLGVSAVVGRTFIASDTQPGQNLKVLLSHTFWTRELLRDPTVVNRAMVLDGTTYTVIGVMPPDFRFPDADAEIWLPFSLDAPPVPGAAPARNTSVPALVPIAHLRGGTRQTINEVVRARGVDVNAAAGSARVMGAVLYPFGRDVDEVTERVLLLLGSAGLLLLCIACVNVAALTISRDLARAHVTAIRAALGASRWALFREGALEHMLAGIAGAAGGVVIAAGVLQVVIAIVPDATVNPVDLDGRVLAYAALVGVLTGCLFGLPTAFRASAASVAGMLQRNSRSVSGSRWTRHARTLLVGAQVSLALVLLVGAGLTGRSIYALYAADRGFEPRELVRIRVGLPAPRYAALDGQNRFVVDALDRLRAVPGVTNASAGEIPSFSSRILLGSLQTGGSASRDDRFIPRAHFFEVSPDYFSLLAIRMIEGSTFGDDDPPGAAVVSESFAKGYWPERSALGQRFRIGEDGWRTVIGVVGDVRRVIVGQTDERSQVYQRLGRSNEEGIGTTVRPASILAGERTLIVRLNDAAPSRQALVEAVTRADTAVIVRTDAVEDMVESENTRSRMAFVLMAGFAICALLVSTAGLYALIGYAVEQQRREFGIRIALGAAPRALGRRVLVSSLVLTGGAITCGTAVVLGAGRVLQSELYGVESTDPATLAAVTVALAATALLAAWRPARRAMRVDPVALLRSE